MISVLLISKPIKTQYWEAKKSSHKFLLVGCRDEIQSHVYLIKTYFSWGSG